MVITVAKVGTWAASVIAVGTIAAFGVTGISWKIRADDSHTESAQTKAEVKSVRELIVILGNKEEIREAKARMEKEKLDASEAAERALIKRLCRNKSLDKDSDECRSL